MRGSRLQQEGGARSHAPAAHSKRRRINLILQPSPGHPNMATVTTFYVHTCQPNMATITALYMHACQPNMATVTALYVHTCQPNMATLTALYVHTCQPNMATLTALYMHTCQPNTATLTVLYMHTWSELPLLAVTERAGAPAPRCLSTRTKHATCRQISREIACATRSPRGSRRHGTVVPHSDSLQNAAVAHG